MLLVGTLFQNGCRCLQVFRHRTPAEAIELVGQLLEYTPSRRTQPMEACAHNFFDELREMGTRLPNGRELPPLFNFTPSGEYSLTTSLVRVLRVCFVDRARR